MPAISGSLLDTQIQAHVLPESSKEQNSTTKEAQPVAVPPNYLSLEPRVVPLSRTLFENDGPGCLSDLGARHDNDFVDIKNIRILPTADEILSRRQPYMPLKRFNQPHFLPRGPERLIDTLFRQLRHESIELLKDGAYTAAQKLATTAIPPSDYDPCEDTPNGNRCYIYWGAQFEELFFHDRKGLMVRLSYLCPKRLRGRKIFNSGRFENGMVVALVGLDDDGVGLSVTFFETYLSQSTDSMVSRGGKGKRAAVQLRFAQPDDIDDLRRTVHYAQGLASGRFALVEFPKCLLNGFYPILARLQKLQGTDLAFTRYYAPGTEPKEDIGLLPPSYALLDEASIDFQTPNNRPNREESPSRKPLRDLIANKDEFLTFVKEETTLDQGQALAFVEAMGSELALIQGPPGTGKTYLGTTLVQAILSAVDASRLPILTVCLTNHALDAFLKELLEKGVNKIARIGSGSREEWTKKYSLRSLSSSMKLEPVERQNLAKEFGEVKDLAVDGADICEAANSPNKLGWFTVSQLLHDKYKDIHRQLLLAARTGNTLHGLGIHKRVGGFPYALWSSGGDLDVFDQRISADFAEFLGQNGIEENDPKYNLEVFYEVLQDIISQVRQNCNNVDENIWILSLRERQELMAKWASEIDHEAVAKEIVDIHLRHQAAVARMQLCREVLDARCLATQQVVGVTTTACASKWSLLKRLGFRVVICEEAGEVMEAHSLCTLLSSVEHAIFIGDPLQLRPQLSEISLSLESKGGSLYRLDESLFERLTSSESGIKTLPHSVLSVQRRMHPDISLIAKKTLYPQLQDHPATKLHPAVGGLADRTYWFDHSVPEDQCFGFSSATKSFSNRFEVGMVSGLVQYLVRSNAYGLGDIAILTPYSGQLAQLVQSLHCVCSLWLSESDKESLLEEGFLTEEVLEAPGRVDIDMAGMLRISTIDNFQGEEAKIVILTTVRSNPECRPGFLKTINRINVACSRARDGFYIFGNTQSLQVVPMWNYIIQLFRSQNRLGTALSIQPCSRSAGHSPGYFLVKQPEDFAVIPACHLRCNQLLRCGHICTESCHPLELHESSAMKCRERCNKFRDTCIHVCQKECGEPCGPCQVPLSVTSLQCGHVVTTTCAERTAGILPVCQEVIEEKILNCGHKFAVMCSFKDQDPLCSEPCGLIFECGHHCTGICGSCSTSKHAPCGKICGQKLNCEHRCNVDIGKTDKLSNILDSLLFVAGKKYQMLGKRLLYHEIHLRETFKLFRGEIRPTPLSAAHNRQLIQERGSGLADVQTHILETKDQFVIPLENDLVHLHKPLELVPKEVNSSFGLRFVLLFYRCRYASLRDLLKVSQFLITLDDPSCQSRILAESIRRTVIMHSKNNASNLGKTITECESKFLKALEVETRLLQLGFCCLVRRGTRLDCLQGRDIADQQPSLPVSVPNDTTIDEDFGEMGPFKLDVDSSMRRMALLCRRYPKSAGLYAEQVNTMRHEICSRHSDPGCLFPAETKVVERAWGNPERFELASCDNHHVYPAGNFDACPECGEKVEESAELNYERFLSEGEFLSWMRNVRN
ncbi:hypothetical protein AJ79_06926 [Helicocarpus griseus UAMH5409]|uniref:Uncharacterized protein n=1 Tax=Helicocarpus griseus UAMH5409 TaxID=1447875 RepID=A0A2B7X7U3_9EURO|nr:hypothetical protein AJ79_06926 [Helicocarpus griseus UAMH5409]